MSTRIRRRIFESNVGGMCSCWNTKQQLSLLPLSKNCRAQRWEKALIAVAHTMLIAIYHILKEKVPYHDLGADYYSIINQEKIINRNIRTLEKLGVNVMIQPK